jgi:hypothetical protein
MKVDIEIPKDTQCITISIGNQSYYIPVKDANNTLLSIALKMKNDN